MNCVAVVDPPRAGLHPDVVRAIRKHNNIRRLIVVSCSIHSMISNLASLCRPTTKYTKGKAFQPQKCIVVDLFPNTPHCEVVLELERTPN